MSLKADGFALLAYDDAESIALISLDDALYELSYPEVEACYDTPVDRLVQRFKQVGQLISGLSVTAPETENPTPDFSTVDAQPDRLVG